MLKTQYPNPDQLVLGKWTVHAKPIFSPTSLHDVKTCFPDADGWIFTKILVPYQPFRTAIDACLKWKQPQHMTIDFKIHSGSQSLDYIAGINKKYTRDTRGEYILSVLSGSGRVLFFGHANLPPHFELDEESSNIGEFSWDTNHWKLVGMRYDKEKANTVETTVRTITDLESGILLEELCEILQD